VQLTVRELAALVGGQFADEAAGARVITGVAAAREAGEGDVTFFGNPKYLAQIKATRATAALVPLDFAEAIPGVAVRVENPSLAFARLVERFAPPPVVFSPGVHPSAVVASDAVLGEGVSIQPGVVIEAGARIGARSVIGAHGYIGHGASVGTDCHFAPRVTVAARCLVGNRVIIHSGAVLGSDGFGFEFSAGRHVKIPQTGIVQVDDDVEVGANTTIDRARFGRTWIGEGTKIDNLVMIAHNVVIGKHCIIVAQVGISGSARLGNYVTLAGQVGVAGHLEIGDQAVVAAQSGVSKSLKGNEMYMGFPAMKAGDYREQIARIARLPKLAERVRRLERGPDSQAKSSAI
jgi:UDP-3-O-[3-hydroxymyristoyl] glucosamine N-acyltransferase